jgi:hypothetical protein
MKTDLCNQIRDAGKMSAHRTNITKSRPLEESRKSNGKYKKLKKGEYTVTQWTKNMSEIAELETEEEADFIQDNVEFIGNESNDIPPIVEEKGKNGIDTPPKVMELEVTRITVEKEILTKKKEATKKKNQAKKRIEKKKCITPVSSPELVYVPSTAEKRREAKVARNQQFLKEKGL